MLIAPSRLAWVALSLLVLTASSISRADDQIDSAVAKAQAPGWSADDLTFFLSGSMSSEFVPKVLAKAFHDAYPALFPSADGLPFGLIRMPEAEHPVGITRAPVAHFGGLQGVGINCASCHVAAVIPPEGGPSVAVLGVTSHFDAEALFGTIIGCTFQSAAPENMQRVLLHYCRNSDPPDGVADDDELRAAIQKQGATIASAMKDELTQLAAAPADKLLEIDPKMLKLTRAMLKSGADAAPVARSLLRIFHNMRAALHVPQQPPSKAPPVSGPGRNNAFGLLSVALFNEPTLYGPAKFGVAWNLADRKWVHWDGNTNSPLVRNLAASLGLGAPLIGKKGMLDFALVDRHTKLSEQIRAPRYPWKIDRELAGKGEVIFKQNCARCHVQSAADEDKRLFALDEVKTDANRAKIFTPHQSELYNKFFGELEVAGYKPIANATRSTQKYVAVDLAGVWARSPYLHNGSVRTMAELLSPTDRRAATFHRGSRKFDDQALGYTDEGAYLFDTKSDGNSNAGHEYGTQLSKDEARQLIEYLKTL